ncbi:MAG: hypothetical protein H6746_04950 [Deltaproteobacteria bacterium]|nr:hypothetical protein [Deltaproteobacteria bacterium]
MAAALTWALLPVLTTALVYLRPAGCWFYDLRRGEQSFSEWATLAQYALAFALLAPRVRRVRGALRAALTVALVVIALVFLEEANWGQVLTGRALFFDGQQRSIHTALQTTDFGPLNALVAVVSELPPLALLFLTSTWLPLLLLHRARPAPQAFFGLLCLPAMTATLTIALFQWGEAQTGLSARCAPTLVEEIVELTDATLVAFLALVWRAFPETCESGPSLPPTGPVPRGPALTPQGAAP